MTSRWGLSESELDSFEKMKLLIDHQIPELVNGSTDTPEQEKNQSFSDVSGERVHIRFLKGNGMDYKLAAAAYMKYLSWRKEMNVDQIRSNILQGEHNLTNPTFFPYSSIISRFIQQSALVPAVVDKSNRPIFLSTFQRYESSSSSGLFKEIPTDQQLTIYLIHWFEYQSLLLDQLSEASEQDAPQKDSTGSILQACQLWDLKDLSWKHFSDPIISRYLSLYFEMSLSYYPEQIGRIHVVNAHWTWVKLWGYMKASFNVTSSRKVQVHKKSSLEHLLSEMSLESIPPHLGGCLLNKEGEDAVSDFTSLVQSKSCSYNILSFYMRLEMQYNIFDIDVSAVRLHLCHAQGYYAQ